MKVIKEKYYKKWKRRNRARVILILAFISIVPTLVFALYSPIFNLKSVEVQGQKKLSREQIISVSGLIMGQNIFKINTSQIRKKIRGDSYVDSVKVVRKLPDKLMIFIIERSPMAAVFYMGSYILIDKNGIALETAVQIQNKKLTEIKGIEFDKFTLGKPISNNESENIKAALNILTLLSKDDLLQRINYINVKDLNKVTMSIDKKYEVILGKAEKLSSSSLYNRFLFLKDKEMLNKELGDSTGYIDMTEEDKLLRFKPYRNTETGN